MTIEEATKLLKMSDQAIWLKGLEKEQKEATEMAIKSLEAWEKIEKEIDDSILICRESAQNNTWCDGELAGFLQSKDIINRNLSEVENEFKRPDCNNKRRLSQSNTGIF